jgi:hypothetical protein
MKVLEVIRHEDPGDKSQCQRCGLPRKDEVF